MYFSAVIVFIIVTVCQCAHFGRKEATCGYQSCNPVKDGMINVHLVPHTHDDVGWLKTVDQYFYGSRNDIQNAGVQYVLDSVIDELQSDPTKRFIYVEIAYFARWWREQHDIVRHAVKGLVNNGQLEFILGGWCMNDEAATYYNDIIDQHSLGFEFLRQNFGDCARPRVGWQIDPFGHSRETASLFAQFGFDGLFFARLDYQDANLRLNQTSMEMLWHGSPDNLKQQADLFTGVLYNGYGPPGGFCFDQFCGDDPIMDDPRLHDYNVESKIADFIRAVQDQFKHYKSNHIMMTMGSDFQYQNAHHWYKNMDKLIQYTNMLQITTGSKINVLYSTPSCYLYQLNLANLTWPTKADDFFPYGMQAHWFQTGFYTSRPALKYYVRQTSNFLQQQNNGSKINVLYSTPSCYLYQLNKAGLVWPEKSDDFFPYAHQAHSFWTGYFTSRAALKGYVRETNTFLQACKQLDALAQLEDSDNSTVNIQILKEALGVVQHHDGVSGTEKQQVAYDYALRLAYGRAECQKVINDALNKLVPKGSEGFPGVVFCDLLNISACEFTETQKQFVMTVYNPLGRPVSRWIRLPVVGNAYDVNGPSGELIQTQIVPVTRRTMNIPERKGSLASNELVFNVSLPALGFSSYFIRMSMSGVKKQQQKSVKQELKQDKDYVMKNEHMSLTFDGKTGTLKGISNLATGIELATSQFLALYYGHPGNCSDPDFEPSGAYIFRPNTSTPQSLGPATSTVITGPLVQETYVYWAWASQVTRLYANEKYAEIEWTVGPIPIDDGWGKEVIAIFNTGMNTNSKFYTDANGREVLERVRDHRNTWPLNQTEPVAGNYYPVNSRIFIQDVANDQQFTVMTDRSQGGSSIVDGQVELMLHRRLLYDDCLGVGEPMNETGSDGNGLIVRGKMFLFLDTITNSGKLHRDFGLRQYMAPIPAFTDTDMKYSEYSQYYRTSWSGLTRDLPDNVHLLTLEQWGGPSFVPQPSQPYLIRLEHFYALGEDTTLSQNVTVDLQDLFVPLNIDSVYELTLGANLPLSALNRLHWNTMNDKSEKFVKDSENVYEIKEKNLITGSSFDVQLSPMQIRTFQVLLKNGKLFNARDKFTVFS